MMNLLIFAYSVDPQNQVFSHQLSAIHRIANQFQKVIVVVPQVKVGVSYLRRDTQPQHKNLEIVTVPWRNNRTLENSVNLILVTLKLLRKRHVDAVFYFMTESYAAILGPILWFKNIQQVLWYAHSSRPHRLLFSKLFMSLICSSTSGSVPFEGRKVRLLGQMVDENLFTRQALDRRVRFNLIHVGRFDPSKRIELLLEAVLEIQQSFPEAKLTLYGSPTGPDGIRYESMIRNRYWNEIESGLLKINPAIKRSELPELYKDMGVFLHSFQGSLDKTIVEATLSGLPVATINKEYINEFGHWGASPITLVGELRAILNLGEEELQQECDRRQSIALQRHSLEQWAVKFTKLLYK